METNKIPEYILSAIHSGKVYSALEMIAEEFGLMIDQLGQLNMDTEKMLTGEIKSESFIKTLEKDLEIPNDVASKIVEKVNSDIIIPLRSSLQKMQSQSETPQVLSTTKPSNPIIHLNPHQSTSTPSQSTTPTNIPTNTQKDPNISAIERVGGFTIEKHEAPTSSYLNNIPHPSKEEVLKKIEDQTPKPSLSAAMVDHLLTTHVDSPEKKEDVVPAPAPVQPTTPQPPTKSVEPKITPEKKSYTTDPYREPI